LIYGFFDDQMNAPSRGEWADLIGNRALSYYFAEDAAALYAPGSRLKRAQFEITRCIPMLAERSSPWGQVEMLRRAMEDVGMPPGKTNRYGRVDDFKKLEATDLKSFSQRCESALSRGVPFSAPIQGIILLAQEHGAKVILVEMPMPSRHRQIFYSSAGWKRMRKHLQELARASGTYYVSASDWVQDDTMFEDATHLNEVGAKNFSTRLATAISRITSPETEVARRRPGAD